MQVSIAMCTYNGGRFLREQLDSIASQTRLPDELLIYDDISTDETLPILMDFTKTVKFPIRIQRNTRRIGPAKNFEKAICASQGDIIVLCDQDDVWKHDKLQILEQVLSKYPDAGYVFSDAILIDEVGKIIHHSLWKHVSFDRKKRAIFCRGLVDQVRVLLSRNVVTGATMAFRGSLKDIILPIPQLWVHDEWIAFASSLHGTLGIPIREPLTYYRQHQSQAIGVPRLGPLYLLKKAWQYFVGDPKACESYSVEFRKWSIPYSLFKDASDRTSTVLHLLEAKAAHVALRATLYRSPRITRLASIAVELARGGYHLYSGGWKSAIKDVLFPTINDSHLE